MMRPEPTAEPARFRGRMRYHHRGGANSQSSWDQWVAADLAGRSKRNWPRIIGILVGMLALTGIAVALVIEMS